MKVVIILACIVGLALSESCTNDDTTSCASEICAAGFVPTCERNICTCSPPPTQPAGGCVLVSDCDTYYQNHHCHGHNRVCENGQCSCRHGHGR